MDPKPFDRPLTLIVNPAAGKGRGGVELVRLRHFLANRNIEAEVFLTRGEGDARVLLDGLPLADRHVVVAVGGDGTAHEVGSALLGRSQDVALGVVPVGSGNDYAALLGMPHHPLRALEAILTGHDERWDVGVVGNEVFLNTVGFGFSASVSYHSHHTGPLRGMPRYLLAVGRALRRFRPLTLGLDGLGTLGSRRITLMEVGIGNRCGGGFHLTAQADPQDGLLDVCLVDAMPAWRMLLLLPRGLWGKHIGHKLVLYEKVTGFRLRLEASSIIHVDGEIRVLEKGEHSLRIRPKALTVRLPGPSAEPTGTLVEAA